MEVLAGITSVGCVADADDLRLDVIGPKSDSQAPVVQRLSLDVCPRRLIQSMQGAQKGFRSHGIKAAEDSTKVGK
jgi:hypothetical protein